MIDDAQLVAAPAAHEPSVTGAVIRTIDIYPVRIPVIRTFRFASGSAGKAGSTVPHVFVRVTDSDGVHGWGEARPSPGWSSETFETVTTTLRQYIAPALVGLPVHDRNGMHDRLDRTLGGHPTGQPMARSAVDIAVHDLLARRAGMPLRAFLGGSAEPVELALSYTVVDHVPADVEREIEDHSAAGFRHFNFKLGVEPGTDIAVAKAVRTAAGPEPFVWADANQSLSLTEARAVARAYEEIGVNLLEQPLPGDAQHEMAQLRSATSLPLTIDEASVSATDYYRYVAAGLVDYLVIKLSRSGGVWTTLQQLGVARAARQGVVVSGLTESLLTRAATAQVAAAYGCLGPAALNGGQFLDESGLFPENEDMERGGNLYLDDRPGIGVEPDETALARLLMSQP